MRKGEFKRLVGVVALAAGVFLAVAAGIPEWKRWQYRMSQTLLDELQPVALSNCTLARVGSANDGGYLMCANLITGLQVAYSYGVGPNDQWGCAVSRQHSVPVHQYDYDPARPHVTGDSSSSTTSVSRIAPKWIGASSNVMNNGEERRHRAAQGRENRHRRR